MASPGSAARNADLFRDVNDRIQVLAGELLVEEPTQFVCECSDLSCLTQLQATAAEYAEVRKDPTRFLVANGHADPAFETVIAGNDRFKVVQKTGDAGASAAKLAH